MFKKEPPTDGEIKQISYTISKIIFSEEFFLLKKELEEFYSQTYSEDDHIILAFQDALYSILSEKELALRLRNKKGIRQH